MSLHMIWDSHNVIQFHISRAITILYTQNKSNIWIIYFIVDIGQHYLLHRT